MKDDHDRNDGRMRGGGIAGDWRSAHPRFDDPMSWSVVIGHASGVTVRVHALLLAFVVVTLIRSVLSDPNTGAATPFDLAHTIMALGTLFLIVLAHEVGHVVACRQTGGDADEIMLWPLGGLAMCDPPRRWTAELWTTLGGPLVNVGIWAVCAVLLGLLAGWKPSVLFPNPFSPSAFSTMPGRALEALFVVHWINWILLLFNLLPIFPLDGGQILRALLARNLEYVDATRTASRVGFVGAIILLMAAIVTGSLILGAVAFMCGATCFVSLRRIDYADAMEEGREDPGSIAERRAEERRAQRRSELEAKRRASLAREEAQLDRILEKIAREGRRSLSWSERRYLKRATKRRRG